MSPPSPPPLPPPPLLRFASIGPISQSFFILRYFRDGEFTKGYKKRNLGDWRRFWASSSPSSPFDQTRVTSFRSIKSVERRRRGREQEMAAKIPSKRWRKPLNRSPRHYKDLYFLGKHRGNLRPLGSSLSPFSFPSPSSLTSLSSLPDFPFRRFNGERGKRSCRSWCVPTFYFSGRHRIVNPLLVVTES